VEVDQHIQAREASLLAQPGDDLLIHEAPRLIGTRRIRLESGE
jgi:hypothetical protein